jgi:hypothetical protein
LARRSILRHCGLLREVLPTDCAVISVPALQELTAELGKPTTLTGEAGVRWTPGAATCRARLG